MPFPVGIEAADLENVVGKAVAPTAEGVVHVMHENV
jgi:hypothetical protein